MLESMKSGDLEKMRHQIAHASQMGQGDPNDWLPWLARPDSSEKSLDFYYVGFQKELSWCQDVVANTENTVLPNSEWAFGEMNHRIRHSMRNG